jgi:hypothetical protein
LNGKLVSKSISFKRFGFFTLKIVTPNPEMMSEFFNWVRHKENGFTLGGRPKITSRCREVGGQVFCDNSTKASVIKSVTMGKGGLKKFPKLRDVIYGRPQSGRKPVPHLLIHTGTCLPLFTNGDI